MAKMKLFYRFSNLDFNTLNMVLNQMVKLQVISFSSLFRDRIEQMKILYYAVNLELYKICTKIVQDKFQLVMSFPGIGLCLYWTLGICTKII